MNEKEIDNFVQDLAKLVEGHVTKRSITGLRSCPFCGSVELSSVWVEKDVLLSIECKECGATGPNLPNELIGDPKRTDRLRVLWNLRRYDA